VARNRAEQSHFVDGFHQIFIGSQERSHAGLIDDRNYELKEYERCEDLVLAG